jgi:hypothetical protein
MGQVRGLLRGIGYSSGGTPAQILTELVSVARRHRDPVERDAAMHAAAQRIEARENDLALSGSAL